MVSFFSPLILDGGEEIKKVWKVSLGTISQIEKRRKKVFEKIMSEKEEIE